MPFLKNKKRTSTNIRYVMYPPASTSERKCAQLTMRDTAVKATNAKQLAFTIALALKLFSLGTTSHSAARINMFAAEDVCPDGKDLYVSSPLPIFTTYQGVKPSVEPTASISRYLILPHSIFIICITMSADTIKTSEKMANLSSLFIISGLIRLPTHSPNAPPTKPPNIANIVSPGMPYTASMRPGLVPAYIHIKYPSQLSTNPNIRISTRICLVLKYFAV